MYCPKCGKEIDENATFCPDCGARVKTLEQPVYTAVPVETNNVKKKNPLAIVSFVLSMVGLFVLPLLFSTAGLVTGIPALNIATEKCNGGGKKFSIWSIILGACGLAYGIIHFLIVYMGG